MENLPLKTRKRGRPLLIDEKRLLQRRKQLLDVFEYHWAEFAWELQRARSIESLREALQPIHDFAELLQVFTYESTRKATWTELRALKDRRSGERVRVHIAIQAQRDAKDRLDRANGALHSAGYDKEVERLCEQRKKRYAMAQEEVAGHNARIEEMDAMIRRQAAFIAQSEFLDFLRGKRYTLNLLNTANAIAGLPYIGWRQSMTRCQKHKAVHPYGFQMQMSRCCSRKSPSKAAMAVEQMRAHPRKINASAILLSHNCAKISTIFGSPRRQRTNHVRQKCFGLSSILRVHPAHEWPGSQFDLVMEDEKQLH